MFTENAFTAARRFLEQNDLPLTYIDQVAQFIEKNAGGVNLGGGNEYADPFTGETTLCMPIRHFVDDLLNLGASRHRPSDSTASVPSASTYSDPFTGGSRYISSESSTVSPPTTSTSHSDPFTGTNRYVSSPAASQSPAPTGSVIPVVGH